MASHESSRGGQAVENLWSNFIMMITLATYHNSPKSINQVFQLDWSKEKLTVAEMWSEATRRIQAEGERESELGMNGQLC